MSKNNSRAIRQYALDGSFVKEFPSVYEASVETDVATSTLFTHCRKLNRMKPVGGFLWRFADNDNLINTTMSAEEILKQTCKVRQYTTEGRLVAMFPNACDAARATGIIRSSISECCLRVPSHFTAGGFVWRFSEDDEFADGDVKPQVSPKWVRVRQLTMDGEFVAEYPSIAEAGRAFGVKKPDIGKVCRGILPHWKGYRWEFVK